MPPNDLHRRPTCIRTADSKGKHADSSSSIPLWIPALASIILIFSLLIASIRIRSEILINKGLASWEIQKSKELALFHLGRAFTWLSQIDPLCLPIPYLQGSILAEANEFEEAKPYMEKALAIHPYQSHLLMDYGKIEGHLKNYTKSIELLERSLQLNPHSKDLLFTLAVLHFQNNNLDRAQTLISQCPTNSSNLQLESYRTQIYEKN